MTTGPIETAYIELLPKTSSRFGADALRQIGPDLDRVGTAVNRSLDRSFASASSNAGSRLKKIDDAGKSMARQVDVSSKRAGDSIDKNISKGTDRATRSFGGLRTAAGAAFAAFSVGAVVQGVDKVVGKASDLNETMSKVNVVLGKGADEAIKFSKGTETAFGQSQQQALDAIATFAAFGKSAGLQGKELAGFATRFDGLASDLASFNNTSPEQAIEAIGAALRGETEPIRAYNVLLDDASLRQKALELGIVKTTKNALTPQQKVLATTELIFEKTKDAQGDFARTSGGLANQQRIAAAQSERLQIAIGKVLQPTILSATKALNTQFLPPLIDFAEKRGPQVTAAIEDFGTKTKAAFDLITTGDFTGGIGKALGVEEDSSTVGFFLGVHDAIESVTNAFNVLVQGDFTGRIFGQEEDSATVDALFRIREAIGSIDDRIKGIDKEALGETFDSAVDSLGKLLPLVLQFIEEMPAFGDVIKVGVQVLGFLADHADTLGKLMPILVAGVLAYKVAQLAANVAAAAGLPLKIAEVVVNRQLVKSNRELIASRGLNTAAQLAESASTTAGTVVKGASAVATDRVTAATNRGRIATIAHTVAERAATVAKLAGAAAARLLGLAMIFALGPVGLIIIAVGLIVTGIVLLATKTKFFQTIWRVAWEAIQKAVSAVFNWIKNNWPLLLAILTGPIGLAVIAIVKHWDKIESTAKAAVEGIKVGFREGLRFVVNLFLGFVQNILDAQVKAFGWIPGIGGKLKDASAAFSTFRDDVNRKLDGIKDESIKISLGYVKSLGQNPQNQNKINNASGGILPGYTPGRDVHTFYSPTGGQLGLSGGEAILRPEATQALGPAWVHRVNAAARRAGRSGVEKTLGFANGGLFIDPSFGISSLDKNLVAISQSFGQEIGKASISSGFNAGLNGVLSFVRSHVGDPYGWGAVGPRAFDCSGLVSAAINTAFGRAPYSRLGSTGTMPWSVFAPGKGAFSVGWFKGNPGHTAATVNGVNIESRGGRGVVMGAAARGATDPLFTNIAHVRGFANGGILDQILDSRLGRLGDPPFDLLNRRGKKFDKELEEAFGRGVLLRDYGGPIPVGTSIVRNRTSRPERVLSHAEEAAMRRNEGTYIAKQTNVEVNLTTTGSTEADAARIGHRVASWSER